MGGKYCALRASGGSDFFSSDEGGGRTPGFISPTVTSVNGSGRSSFLPFSWPVSDAWWVAWFFPKVSSFYGKNVSGAEIDGSLAFCKYMLNKQHIAIVPGIGFGADEHVRISYATSMDNLEKALDRFENGLKELK